MERGSYGLMSMHEVVEDDGFGKVELRTLFIQVYEVRWELLFIIYILSLYAPVSLITSYGGVSFDYGTSRKRLPISNMNCWSLATNEPLCLFLKSMLHPCLKFLFIRSLHNDTHSPQSLGWCNMESGDTALL
jgi:hypothetical protein